MLVAQLSGSITLDGSGVIRTIRCYIRSTGVLYDSISSNPDGTFTLNAPDDSTLMFIIAFDDIGEGQEYNALIYDKVTGFLV